jgi:transcriptional regulator with XRE-family HTH domain
MSHFGGLLKEARLRARLTQKELGEKVGVDDSYISKIEAGVNSPPKGVILELLEALGIIKKSRRWQKFLLAAGVASAEDMEGFKLVEERNDQVLKAGTQAISTPMPKIVHSAKAIPYGNTPGKEIDRLLAVASLSKEEKRKVAGEVMEFTKRLLTLIETLRKKEEEK